LFSLFTKLAIFSFLEKKNEFLKFIKQYYPKINYIKRIFKNEEISAFLETLINFDIKERNSRN
jgi:hypothetical protein